MLYSSHIWYTNIVNVIGYDIDIKSEYATKQTNDVVFFFTILKIGINALLNLFFLNLNCNNKNRNI